MPDSILGTAWPTMRLSLGLPLEAAGIFTMVTTFATAISSFVSGHIISRLGTGKVTFISCLMTGSMLLCYSFAPTFPWLLLCTVPLGFGAGAVDTGLNNFVAKHYSSRQMNWLHCFWGVGASLGPVIMTMAIKQADSWRTGYRSIGLIQLALSIILLASLPLWKNGTVRQEATAQVEPTRENIMRHKGVWLSIAAFPIYVGMESGMGLWLGSYLVEGRSIAQTTAGIWISLFYASIMTGRLISGFVSEALTNRRMIRLGLLISILGIVLLFMPVNGFLLPAIILTGLGCAPVFPCMVHETPKRFTGFRTEIITGYQVGMAYLSGVALIPLIGLLAGRVSLWAIPACVLLFAVLTLVCTERLNKIT